ncbi:MAG: prolyl oligopeptidase family serine peptidase [Aureliella sp.]
MRTLARCALGALFGLSLSVLTTSPARADGPGDNKLDNVRPIPPAGIELSSQTKDQLLEAADRLEDEIAKIGDAKASDRDEVLVIARAVRMAVEDGMFYAEKEVDQARELIKLADARIKALQAGTKGAKLIGADEKSSDKPQLVVGGFRSHIDGSVQPYGLVLPAETNVLDGKPRRLDVWLHGRGEKTSEVAFLYQRLKSVGEIAPPNTIVLHPYGRYCNAFKFAGEIDVLEAIDHVKRLFAIDDNRITIRGFSMGGAGCWQMAVHYPGKWMAATPGAGFSETTEFLRVFQNEDFRPGPTQKMLLHWYDCTDWANNLKLLPTIAYSGEIDKQKQAADMMEAAMKERGLKLNHIIGPQTAHKLHPDSKVEIERFLEKVAEKGRPAVPTQIDFTTYTLRYANDRWLTIEGMGEHWQEARVQAELQPPICIAIKTKNVTRLKIELPADQQVLRRGERLQVTIDGDNFDVAPPSGDAGLQLTLSKTQSGWNAEAGKSKVDDQLRKRPGLQGPIDDAFLDAFLFVGPENRAYESVGDKWVAEEFKHAKREWRRQYRGDVVERKASEVSNDDIANNNLILFGTPSSNPLIAKIIDKLPITWSSNELAIGSNKLDANKYVAALVYPNPLNPKRYVVLNSGFTFREYAYLNNARQIATLPDWALLDVTSGRNAQQPGTIAAAGFFDEAWKVK